MKENSVEEIGIFADNDIRKKEIWDYMKELVGELLSLNRIGEERRKLDKN